MDNILKFPKSGISNKQELQNIILKNLLEHGAIQEDVDSVLKRMSAFLDIICESEFSLSIPNNPTKDDIEKLIMTIREKISQMTNELILERFNAESFYLKGD